MVSNKRYFSRRASEEAMRAERACTADARQWHQELADKFNRLADEFENQPLPRALPISASRSTAAG
jgi:hypothetical protein